MQQNFIDGSSQNFRRFGELYSDRNIRLAGEARYLSGSSQVETRGLKIICTPTNGGAEAITTIPDGLYSLPATDSSIWLQIRRTAGSTTAILGTTLLQVGAGAQTTPLENWVQLFYRSSVVGEIISFGSFLIGVSPSWTRIGITRANGIYDAIVGQNPADPNVTHTNIQTAINDCVDGNRILILEGTYNITSATGYSATSALSWSGKTLSIEGEGYGTIIQNGGAFARAFSIQSTNAGVAASSGSASKIFNLQISQFNQTVQFDGGAAFGIRNCDVNIWQTNFITASYVAPAVVGTGTSEQNSVREKTISLTGVAQEKYTIASSTTASNIVRTEASGTLTLEELVDFQRPTSGYGILPIGSVLATFPALTGAYVCSATTAADARGFVQCNGQTIVDATSPMNGAVIPNINNNIFLMGNVTSGLTGGANNIGTTVPAAGLTVSGTNVANSVTWASASVSASGSGSFSADSLNGIEVQNDHLHSFAHTHSAGTHTHNSGDYYAKTAFHTQLVLHEEKSVPNWTANMYHEGGDFRGSSGATSQLKNVAVDVAGNSGGGSGNTGGVNGSTSVGGGRANWKSVAIPVTVTGVSLNKNAWNSDQNAHNHTWSGSVAGTATAASWDNRPLYITARYIMRIK